MSTDFLTYLAHECKEFSEFSKKYGTPSPKRIKKILEGILLNEEPVIRKQYTYAREFFFDNKFDNLDNFVDSFKLKMVEFENILIANTVDFIGINSFKFSNQGVLIYIDVLESIDDYEKRNTEYNRVVELNKLADVIKYHAGKYDENNINLKKKSIQNKIDELQNELKKLK